MSQTTNQKLHTSVTLLLATFEAADYGILILGRNSEVVSFNQKLIDIWQIPATLLVEKDGNKFLAFILDRLAKPYACEVKAQTPQSKLKKYVLLKLNNGKTLECYYQTQRLEGKNIGCIWGFRDVTEPEQARAIAHHKARHDTLTKLPRRTIIICQLSEAIVKAQTNSSMLAVILVDLDRFKLINDTLLPNVFLILQLIDAKGRTAHDGEATSPSVSS